MDQFPRTLPDDDQESVWDYPRPPRVEPTSEHVVVCHRGAMLADTRSALRVLETSHPPNYYLPPDEVDLTLLVESPRKTWCEWKGEATYFDVSFDGVTVPAAAWAYRAPTSRFAAIRDHITFYPQLVQECRVDGELVSAVQGSFYGGWVTSRVAGPFKGGPGTTGW